MVRLSQMRMNVIETMVQLWKLIYASDFLRIKSDREPARSSSEKIMHAVDENCKFSRDCNNNNDNDGK